MIRSSLFAVAVDQVRCDRSVCGAKMATRRGWSYHKVTLTLSSILTWSYIMIAERLSVRQIIPRRISEIVYMYPSRLGMPLFRATRANVGITCARVTPRNVTGSSPPDLNTLHEIDSQVCALRFVSLRCRTALCITALSDDRRLRFVSLRFVSLRCQTTADIYRQRSSISKLEEDAS